MGKLICYAKKARMNYQQKIGKDVSIQEVADAVGMTRAALSNLENGKSLPNPETIAKLCGFYNISVGELLEYVPDDPSGNDSPLRLAV